MKKFIICIAAAVVWVCPVLAEQGGEKYFNRAVNYYLEGNLDRAENNVIRAIQLEPENSKYGAFFDLIEKERQKTRIINLRNSGAAENIDVQTLKKLRKRIGELEKNSIRRDADIRSKVNSLMGVISSENSRIESVQKTIIKNRLPRIYGEIEVLHNETRDNLNFILIGLAIIFLFILITIFVIITYSRRIKKLRQVFKYLKMRQDEQIGRLKKIEEDYKRLNNGL
ncbi:MAG: hypothetical protein ACLFP1_02925 [Candidatus Goldiibacteriota bacterium]